MLGGSVPAESPPLPTPPGFDEIQQEAMSRLYGRVTAVRLIALPVALLVGIVLALVDPGRWRLALLGGVLVPLGLFFVAEAVRYRNGARIQPWTIPWNLAALIAGQSVLALATGALESPITYAFVPTSLLLGLFASRRAHLALLGLQLAAVWLLAALELSGAFPGLNLAVFGGGARAGHTDAHLLTGAVVLSAVMALGSRLGRGVRGAFDAMLVEALHAREGSLRAHAERAEELTALSAEIAHELKNPLATVKGLAALLSSELAHGKGAERLAVLRREVDRMQGRLAEFLEFSRPLVPLALTDVELTALARELAALHEGLASERGARFSVTGTPCRVRGDARKLAGVLLNLLQNALEASPPGASIEVEVEVTPAPGPGPRPPGTRADRDEVQVRVLDRGPGLAPELASKAFEPGVTTKPRGSGLGLTIGRAIARQHGGEVELRARPGGGCVALLRLPVAPPAALPGNACERDCASAVSASAGQPPEAPAARGATR